MYEFYGAVLGFKQLSTLNVGNGGGVARFQAGAQELKLTRRVGNRSYVSGGVRGATGLRLLTFFFADEAALCELCRQGLPIPEFATLGAERALGIDPDGQQVELVIVPGATAEQLARIEVGSHRRGSRGEPCFLPHFRGARGAAAPSTTRFSTRASIRIVTARRRSACAASVRPSRRQRQRWNSVRGLRRGIVDALAKGRHVTIDQPLSGFRGFDLRTVWLADPDGVTNYFAETGASRRARTSPVERKKKRRALVSSPLKEGRGTRMAPALEGQMPMAVLIAACCFVTNCSKVCSAGFSLRAVSTLRFASISLSKSR